MQMEDTFIKADVLHVRETRRKKQVILSNKSNKAYFSQTCNKTIAPSQ